MRKFIIVNMCLLVLLLSACNTNRPDPTQNSNSTEYDANGIQSNSETKLENVKYFSWDIAELQEQIKRQIDAVDNQIKMPFWYTPGAEIFFFKNGQIAQANFYLSGVTKPSTSTWYTTSYMLEYRPSTQNAIFDGTIKTYNEDLALSKNGSQREKDNFKYFESFMNWAAHFDFENLLQNQPEPAIYELLAGNALPYEILTDDRINCTLLDVSSNCPMEISKSDIPVIDDDYSDANNEWFETFYDYGGENVPLVYYVLLPYYHSEDREGWAPEQVLQDDGSYLVDQKTWNQDYRSVLESGEYRINDILILFPNGINSPVG